MRWICAKTALLGCVAFCLSGSVLQADVFQFEIFSNNGLYNDDPGVNLWVDVSNGAGIADFTFYNDGPVNCSIAAIYVQDGVLLGIDEIVNGPGTLFSRAAPGPGNLPEWNMLDPDFHADREFTIGSVEPPPENGVNNVLVPPEEWVMISFELNGDLADVIDELNDGTLRIGLHVIAFDDGSSESAILVPEPTTIFLFGLGAVGLLRRRYGQRS